MAGAPDDCFKACVVGDCVTFSKLPEVRGHVMCHALESRSATSVSGLLSLSDLPSMPWAVLTGAIAGLSRGRV